MRIQTGRDPFARETIGKKRVYLTLNHVTGCTECGFRKTTKTGREFLYKYTVDRDGIYNNLSEISGLFCGVDCLNSYHGH